MLGKGGVKEAKASHEQAGAFQALPSGQPIAKNKFLRHKNKLLIRINGCYYHKDRSERLYPYGLLK
jgi:hypothetical protein